MRPLTLGLCLLFGLPVLAQNGPCTEKSMQDQSGKADASVWADDSYFYSRALDHPVVGKATKTAP